MRLRLLPDDDLTAFDEVVEPLYPPIEFVRSESGPGWPETTTTQFLRLQAPEIQMKNTRHASQEGEEAKRGRSKGDWAAGRAPGSPVVVRVVRLCRQVRSMNTQRRGLTTYVHGSTGWRTGYRLECYVNGMKNIAREQRDSRDSAFFTYHTTRALASIAKNDIPEGLENTMEFLVDHLRMFEPPASRESGTDVNEYIAKKRRQEEAHRDLDEGDAKDELEYMDEDGPDAVEAIQNLEDELVADRMMVDKEFDDSRWPEDYHMVPAPSCCSHRRIESPSVDAPIAGPSGLTTEEKEKENTPGMEVVIS
ncbi:hypothetical protein B0H13DRAFT_2390925 [Mycena leptocephala]|nr:hypothetical protein B0H13DRAFT_2390925 [Mycena leptocephala]